MEAIAKPTARILCELLTAYGVRHVVLSPGTRSAPLAIALSRSACFDIRVVVDERTAAFVGLGMASALGEPVALVCTSGTALLNYAPALAEAFYRRIPLIAISADRPSDMIDQRDSQTMRQYGALSAVVRRSVDIADTDNATQLRYANRLINEALSAASGPHPGPVHINMQFDAPLTAMCEHTPDSEAKYTPVVYPPAQYDFREILREIPQNAKVLIAAGDMPADNGLARILADGMQACKYYVYAEAASNLGACRVPCSTRLNFDDVQAPDILISIGGALVGARMKAYLRGLSALQHISVGLDDNIHDTFFAISKTIACPPGGFLEALRAHLEGNEYFCSSWHKATRPGAEQLADPAVRYLQTIIDELKPNQIHFSNGSAVRYSSLLRFSANCKVYANRGVSGIEGSTSTAIGSAMVDAGTTLLVSGDMSAAYDMGAFAIADVPANFKMIVLDNGGGDIFRSIKPTGHLPEREQLFAVSSLRFPVEALAQAYGFSYYTTSQTEAFVNESASPAILHLKLPAGSSKTVM